MQAAFVDIGLPRAAFLYVGDIYHHVQDLDFMVNEEEHEESEEAEDSITEGIPEQLPPFTPIEDLCRKAKTF